MSRKTSKIDIWSLGCIFYFILTRGGHPYGDKYVLLKFHVTRFHYRPCTKIVVAKCSRDCFCKHFAKSLIFVLIFLIFCRLYRTVNIVNNNKELGPIKHLPEAKHLIDWMLKKDPLLRYWRFRARSGTTVVNWVVVLMIGRPSIAEVAKHPFFWSVNKKMDFLLDVDQIIRTSPSKTSFLGTLITLWQMAVA